MRLRTAVAVLLITPAAASAQPACVAGTFASYLSLGAGGCTIGGVTLRDFALPYLGAVNAPYSGDVTLTPFTRLDGPGTVVGLTLAFSPALAASQTYTAGGSGDFSQATGVGFTADAGPGTLIGGVRLYDLTGTTTASPAADENSGRAAVSSDIIVSGENLYATAFTSRTNLCSVYSSQCGADVARNITANGAITSGAVALRVNAGVMGPGLGVVQPPITYSASLTSVAGGVFVAPALTFAPEPSTFALAAIGGVALAGVVVRRRRG